MKWDHSTSPATFISAREVIEAHCAARREKAHSYVVGNTRYTVFLRYSASGTIRHRIATRSVKAVK